ncbi:hypothetical protein [Anoxynatronum buryatiense]|uniref:Uncharacterized protein n=1 Tax=Anoxynatronum buryatiense TaxID=489973 RepID=A0AA45WTF1_9CLOT|nr:hypothetical protein [Anoxynatronum buryatiense]SMP41929.1 hypothetical protein SAMN06296020_101565 [Anoxynatronum buryatiense]
MEESTLHMKWFYETLTLAFQMEIENTVMQIEKHYFADKVFDESAYRAADDFVFRRDVTELSYGKTFQLTYDALMAEDFSQYLLGLKVILVKLRDHQRYTYFDRTQMLVLLKEMDRNTGCGAPAIPEEKIPDFTRNSRRFLPTQINFVGIEKGRKLSRPLYHRHETITEAALEKEFKAAAEQGVIYHHIVATDQLIVQQKDHPNPLLWVHLAKLLAIHYATEKTPWNRDLTDAFLEAFEGLISCTENPSTAGLYQVTSGIIGIWIKRLKANNQTMNNQEKAEFLNFLINTYVMSGEEKLLIYILKLAEGFGQGDTSYMDGINRWIAAQSLKDES